ncbi:MAG TPA: hypothetical protein VGL05_31210 [Kribbella sp.]
MLRSTMLKCAVLGSAVLRAALLLRTGTMLRSAVLRALLRAAVRLALLGVLRVPVLAGALGREVLPLLTVLRLTVLWPRTAGTWVRRGLVLVGHMLPRWLRWPHRRTCKG